MTSSDIHLSVWILSLFLICSVQCENNTTLNDVIPFENQSNATIDPCLRDSNGQCENSTTLNTVTNIDNQANVTIDPCIQLHFNDPVPEYEYETPFFEMTTTSNITDYDVTTTTKMPDAFLDNLSEAFTQCPLISITPECYERVDNDTVYVPIHDVTFNSSNYYIMESTKELFICPDFIDPRTEKSTFQGWMTIISMTGIGISALGVAIHIATFLLLAKLRNLPGCCLFSLCIALMTAYLCIFARMITPVNMGCLKLGEITFFSFLASFFWMNVMSYDVWRALRLATHKLRRTGEKGHAVRFIFYSLYSWGIPLIIMGSGLTMNHFGILADKYKLYFDRQTCWFRYKQALVIYFGIPIFTLLAANIVFYMLSAFMICSSSFKREGDNNVFMWSRFFASFRLAAVMGLTWIFGVLATATRIQVFWYFYALFTSLQGVFIFFGFTLSDKTKMALKSALKRKK